MDEEVEQQQLLQGQEREQTVVQAAILLWVLLVKTMVPQGLLELELELMKQQEPEYRQLTAS